MKKSQLLQKVDDAWASFKASFAGLSDAGFEKPGALGEWSVKDILGHVTAWEEESLKHLPVILEGKRPPRYKDVYGGIDAFNARTAEEKRSLPLADALKQLDEIHARLVAYLGSAPDEEFVQTRFRWRIYWDTYGHYPQHTAAILEWRERSGL